MKTEEFKTFDNIVTLSDISTDRSTAEAKVKFIFKVGWPG